MSYDLNSTTPGDSPTCLGRISDLPTLTAFNSAPPSTFNDFQTEPHYATVADMHSPTTLPSAPHTTDLQMNQLNDDVYYEASWIDSEDHSRPRFHTSPPMSNGCLGSNSSPPNSPGCDDNESVLDFVEMKPPDIDEKCHRSKSTSDSHTSSRGNHYSNGCVNSYNNNNNNHHNNNNNSVHRNPYPTMDEMQLHMQMNLNSSTVPPPSNPEVQEEFWVEGTTKRKEKKKTRLKDSSESDSSCLDSRCFHLCHFSLTIFLLLVVGALIFYVLYHFKKREDDIQDVQDSIDNVMEWMPRMEFAVKRLRNSKYPEPFINSMAILKDMDNKRSSSS